MARRRHKKAETLEEEVNKRSTAERRRWSTSDHVKAQEGPVDTVHTPFQPPVERHARLLTEAVSGEQRAGLVMRLQQTYGNAYVRRLLGSGSQARMVQHQAKAGLMMKPGPLPGPMLPKIGDKLEEAESAADDAVAAVRQRPEGVEQREEEGGNQPDRGQIIEQLAPILERLNELRQEVESGEPVENAALAGEIARLKDRAQGLLSGELGPLREDLQGPLGMMVEDLDELVAFIYKAPEAPESAEW